jgi:hypothetical protein
MRMSGARASQVSGGVMLIGLGVLFATHYWWPGILFVVGACALAQGLVEGRGWYALQGAIWLFAMGVWFALGSSLAVLFVALGASMILGVLIRPPFAAKPKADNWLE